MRSRLSAKSFISINNPAYIYFRALQRSTQILRGIVIERVLLKFLENGLVNVGGDDVKLEKLSATSSDLATFLKNAPEKTASFALIAFDPEAPVNDPVVADTLEALKKRWLTYGNTFPTAPIAVVRAMLLDAIVQAAEEDERVAVVFAACARNVLPYIEAGSERAIWADVVRENERRVDARAEAEWLTPSTVNVEKLKLSKPPAVKINTGKAKVDKELLLNKIFAASGPHKPDGTSSGPSPNPYWPNAGQQWSLQFAPKLTAALAETIDAVGAAGKVEALDFSAPLDHFSVEVSDYSAQLLKVFGAATAGLQRRTNLLWWKEALFSSSAQTSYRNLTPTVAAATMALDLYLQLPTLSPVSVAAFLQEAVRSLPQTSTSSSHTLHHLFAEARSHNELRELRRVAGAVVSAPEGRGFLLSLIAHTDAATEISNSKFRELVGVPADTSLNLPEWSTWLFRELQAARAAASAAGSERKDKVQ